MLQLHDLHRNVSGLLSSTFAGRDIQRDEDMVLLPSLEAGGSGAGRVTGPPTALLTAEEAVAHEALLQSLEKEHFPSRGGGGGSTVALTTAAAPVSEHDSLNHDDFARLINATVHGDFGDDGGGHDFDSIGSPSAIMRGEGSGALSAHAALQNSRSRAELEARSRLYSFDDPTGSWDSSSASHYPLSHALMQPLSRDGVAPIDESGASYWSNGGGGTVAATTEVGNTSSGTDVMPVQIPRPTPLQQQRLFLQSRSNLLTRGLGGDSGSSSSGRGRGGASSRYAPSGAAPSRKRSRVDVAGAHQVLNDGPQWAERAEETLMAGVKETIAL
jgi:hypothetical protein